VIEFVGEYFLLIAIKKRRKSCLYLGQITHNSGSKINSGTSSSRFSSGISGSGFSSGSSSGSGGNAWVRAGKKFLPVAIRFGKRYYQRRKYSKGMYAGIGAGAGYYAGSRYGSRYPSDGYYGQQYPESK